MAIRSVEDVLIAIRGSSEDFQDAMADARRALDRIPNTTTKEFSVATGQAEEELRNVRRMLLELDATDVDAEVHAEVGRAIAQIEAFKRQLDSIPRERNVSIDVRRDIFATLGQLGRGFDRLGAGLERTQAPATNFSQVFFRLFSIIKGIAPLVASLAILLGVSMVSAIAALAASLTSALGGLAAFAAGLTAALGPVVAVAIAVFSRLTKVLEARQAAEQAKDAATREGVKSEQEAARVAEERLRIEEAVRDARQGLATAERNYAQAVEQAQDTIRNAIREHEDALRSLEDAHRNLAQTTADAYRAMEDAVEAARDAVLDLRGAQLGMDRARLEIRRARLELRKFADEAGLGDRALTELTQKITDVDFDQSSLRAALRGATRDAGMDDEESLRFEELALRLREAVLGEKEAVDRLSDSRRNLRRAREEEARYQREGIAAYEPYRAAVQSVQDAERRLADATREVNRVRADGVRNAPAVVSALEGVRDAQERLNRALRDQRRGPVETLGAAATAAEVARQKFLELSAAEREFFTQLQGLGDYLRSFFQPITDAVFRGMTVALELLPSLMEPLRGSFESLGSAISTAMRALLLGIANPDVIQGIASFVRHAEHMVALFGRGFGALLRIFMNLAEVALPLAVDLMGEFVGWLERAADSTSNFSRLATAVNTMTESLRIWLRLIGAVLDALIQIAVVMGPFGDELVSWITDAIKSFTEWLKTAEGQKRVREFFRDTIPAVKGLITFIYRLVVLFIQFMQFIGPIAQGWYDAVNPVLELFSDMMELLLKIPGLIRYVLGAFLGFRFIGTVFRGIGTLIGRIPTLISQIPGVIGRVAPAVGEALGVVTGFFSRFVSRLGGIPGRVGQIVGNVVGWFFRMGPRVGSALETVFNFVRSGFNRVLNWIGTLVAPFRNAAIRIRDGLVNVFRGIGNRIYTLLGAVASVFKDVINAVIDVVNFAIRAINSATPDKIDMPLGLPDIPGIPDIPEIPKLASGGLVTAATAALVGEGRHNEAVLPLSRSVLSQLGRAIARHVSFPAPQGFRGGFAGPGLAAALSPATGRGINIERIELPPPPEGGVPDARVQAAQLAAELRRRGGR